jgi:hypothetical protein
MPVEILEIRTVNNEFGEPDSYVVEFEISNGQGAYLWRIGGIQLGTTKAQAAQYLQNHFDEIYEAAEKGNEPAPDLVDNPHIEVRRVLKALALVMVDEINILRAEHGLAPRTDQQAYNAVRAKYIKLGQE